MVYHSLNNYVENTWNAVILIITLKGWEGELRQTAFWDILGSDSGDGSWRCFVTICLQDFLHSLLSISLLVASLEGYYFEVLYKSGKTKKLKYLLM